MNENENATNDVVTTSNDANDTTTHDDAKTSSRRDTTRALRNLKLRVNEKSRNIRDDENNEIHVVKTSTNALRIDHSICYENNVHAKTRNDREQCRKRVERANAKKTNKK
jgi:hypothetical protein